MLVMTIGRCVSLDESAHECDEDPGDGDRCLDVSGEVWVAAKPSKSASENPAPGQRVGLFCSGGTSADLECSPTKIEERVSEHVTEARIISGQWTHSRIGTRNLGPGCSFLWKFPPLAARRGQAHDRVDYGMIADLTWATAYVRVEHERFTPRPLRVHHTAYGASPFSDTSGERSQFEPQYLRRSDGSGDGTAIHGGPRPFLRSSSKGL